MATTMEQKAEELYPIAVLIEELKHEEVSYRLNAIRRLSTIALALGSDRTREELIPFLDESIEDEDEVLLALAEELGGFVDYIGGPQYAHVLLAPLENLSAVEEAVVRDKAVESIAKIAQVLNKEQIEHFYLPMTKRLSSGDWFTSRTSACSMFSPIYSRSSAIIQEELRKLFAQLCKDDTPMVRRAAATNLPKLVKSYGKDHAISDLCPLFTQLASDDHDSVRLLTVEACITISETIKLDEKKTLMLGPLRSLYNDKSWRVRYVVAEKFVRLAQAVGKEIISEDLVSAFVHLLKDSEAEVRTAACQSIPGFGALIDSAIVLKEIIPCVKELVTDSSPHVRAAVALQISGLAPLLGKEHTIEHLLNLFLQCLRDDSSDVRLNIISKLDNVNKVIGIELLSQSLLPAIVELSEDKQWRVRLAIIEFMPLLAKQLGVEFFNDKLSSMCLGWLSDPIFSIREAATVNLRRLIEVFGAQWAKNHILQKVTAFGNHTVFTYRITTIFAMTAIAHALPPEMVKDDVLPTLLMLAKDPIPNIRFNVAKSLESVAPLLKKSQAQVVKDQIKPALSKLADDTDPDKINEQISEITDRSLEAFLLHSSIMHLMYHLDQEGKRVYTLKKTIGETGRMTLSAHPARFSPDDKYSRQRVTIKKRFGILPTQLPDIKV